VAAPLLFTFGDAPLDTSAHTQDAVASKMAAQQNSAWLRIVAKLDTALAFVTEVPAAILVFLEIIVLFSGVISRYALHRPLTWSDELASVMFLWLAMLGAVVAFRRSAHMRMTALVDLAPPEKRVFFDLLGVVAGATFLALVGYPAFEFAIDEAIVTSPSLEISNAWRASALPVGILLMGISALLKFAEESSLKRLLSAIGIAVVSIGLLYALSPLFQDLGNLNLFIFFVVIVAILVLTGVPIAFAFGLATFGYIA
jgi:TRAP-type C4-dicarboxylate transport system permease small subunit